MTPTNRTIKFLEARGIRCGNVERFVHQAGPHGKRYDLFGFLDAIACYPLPQGISGLQITSGSNVSARIKKIEGERREEFHDFLRSGGAVEVWGWRKLKLKRGGKAERWTPRILRAARLTPRSPIQWIEIPPEEILKPLS